jgi:hypothetical protein
MMPKRQEQRRRENIWKLLSFMLAVDVGCCGEEASYVAGADFVDHFLG